MDRDCEYQFDERRIVCLPGNKEKAIEYAVKDFIANAQEAIEKRDRFCVALSGGSTPKEIFKMLSLPKYREAIKWEKVFWFWTDERAVPPEHKDSNYKMAMDNGFLKLPINPDQVFRMKAERKIEENAMEYEKLIKKHVIGEKFDHIWLGMGDDGHTASLFPETRGLEIRDQLVYANNVPQKSCMRMTFTFTLINRARNISIYVMGPDKSKRLCEVLSDRSASFPSGKVGTFEHPGKWVLDSDAAKDLMKVWSSSERPKKAM